ncbi:TetR/AcrR family transcriptional regulator [Rhodococcus sp. 24CO]|uniref:TetR/AcrR family transcriptional regulator n=1 Tax=Rhodococcus sp. 24CO TaxID=3117460 RepID=UPI003D332373
MSSRAKILAAATELLNASPDGEISTRAVCERAGVGAPALYRQFGDKDGLLAAVVDAGFTEYLDGKRAAVPSADPVADLRAGWDSHTAFALAHPAHYRLLHSPSAKSAETTLHAQALLRSVLERCAAAGVLTVSVDVATQMVMSANAGVALMLVVRPEQYPDPTLSQRVRDGILASVINESGAQPDATLNTVASTLDAQLATADSTCLSTNEVGLLREWLRKLSDAPKPFQEFHHD